MVRSMPMKWIGLCAFALGCGSSGPRSTTPVTEPTGSSPVTTPAPAPPATAEGPARSAGGGNRCAGIPLADISIDGLLDDWRDAAVLARVGAEGDGAVGVRCAWDGSALAFAIDIKDDRIVRVKGGTEDHVTLAVSAGGKPVTVIAYPGNNLG